MPHSTAPRFRKETAWVIDTGYQESLDVNEQLQQIVTQLRGKALIINEMKQIHSMECKFSIVIKIEEGHTPALYLDKSIAISPSAPSSAPSGSQTYPRLKRCRSCRSCCARDE
ncbi:DUF4279 domain-containing protein [Paenibacillus auburnensis]|uniref:DUF4279 domain-containing protein n=1 Tax=Paenibacillus auburnensis TaxID=2905649 RepID=UPI001F1CD316|nr:DUF4279 domain-containing protein [Paenibacillus auburnensis]